MNQTDTEDTPIPGADAKSFAPLSNSNGPFTVPSYYAKDNNHIYDASYPSQEIISDADSQTFVPIYDSQGNWSNYFKDQNYVFGFGDNAHIAAIPDSDPTSFTLTTHLGYCGRNCWTCEAKDKSHTYDDGIIIQ